MKIYIVNFWDNSEDGDTNISKAFANKKTALSFISKFKKATYDDIYYNECGDYTLREIDLPISKKGLLAAINEYESSYQNTGTILESTYN